MVRTPYRSSRRIISDSEDSDIEEIKKTPLSAGGRNESVSPLLPGPSIPRMTFPKVPLTPRRDTNFVPTPMKKIDFSSLRKTPGRKVEKLRFITIPLYQTISPDGPTRLYEEEIGDNGVLQIDDEFKVEDNDLISQLDLGSLKLDDVDEPIQAEEVICIEDDDEDDVDGMLHSSPIPSSSGSERLSPESPTNFKIPTCPPPSSSKIPVRAFTPMIVESDSDAESVIWNPTPRRTPGRRRLVASDSESDSDPDSPCHHHHSASSPAVQHDAGPSKPKSTKRKPAALKLIEDQALDYGDESEEGEVYDEEDTLGSLRDFIVDDDYDSEDATDSEDEEDDEDVDVDESEFEEGERSGEGEEDEDSDGIEILSTPPRNTKPPKDRSKTPNRDEGILHYSPPRKLHNIELPNFDQLVIASSESEDDQPVIRDRDKRKKSILTKKTKGSSSEKSSFSNKAWAEERARIANSIFKDLDERVFEGKLGNKGVGARVEWNNRLLTTAGVARIKRITKNGDSKKDHWIELSEKVLTGEKQIINTVAHEMCHLATWVISNEFRNPHGRIFKSWGRKVMHARRDIEVTTTHAYTIEYKYEWKCSTAYCGKIYKRHSKSIDITKQACGSCKGKLVPLFETKQKSASAFQVYLKENMKYAKSAMPGSSHGEVMRALSKRWNEVGEKGDHEQFWKSIAVAVR